VPTAVSDLCAYTIQRAPISTWFRIGGRADHLAKPATIEQLRACIAYDPNLRILGDGANLLVDDDGVGDLVVDTSDLSEVEWEGSGLVRAQAGARLPRLIVEAVRRGLGGIEGLAGIPGSVGGAVFMNAGGAFGEVASVVERVRVITRDGAERTLERSEIDFAYRSSGLHRLIIAEVELRLVPGDAPELRGRLKEAMAYKKRTQPMACDSAGCVFKNPTLGADLDGLGARGERVSAGKIIDRAGCMGLRAGGAEVSTTHANFVVTSKGARAGDVIQLMEEVGSRVHDAFGVTLEPELVVWRRR
jgi:UDP-N-acetylmuramate dehydrogenase